MKYIFILHARQRMAERSISKKFVIHAIANPTKVLYDESGRILIKKLYKTKGAERLLLIVGETSKDLLTIVTVIDTTKIKKYL